MQEAITSKARLHPLLTTAAASVIVFSGVGVAALTGVLPHSASKEAPQAVASAPAPAEAPAPEAAPTLPADEVPMPPAAAKSTPAPKPAHKKVARKPVQVAQAPQAQGAPVPPPPPGAAAPAPLPGALGVVESVREVTDTPKTNGSGPILGGLAGAVAGHQVGHGTGNTLATIVGAAGGALGGMAVEGKVRETKHWEVAVRLDDGTTQTLRSESQPFWHGGERVRLVDGRLQPV